MAQVGNDEALRSSLIWLAVVMLIVGICTQSLKKMLVTYVVGVLGIAGILLPDWDFFDRDFSRWCYPVTAEERAFALAQRQVSLLRRYRIYPVRLVVYTIIYGFALYKWWMFVSN
ncbi:signal peptidase complex-like protein DTM1 [Mangifera indica]|uniref:signal peptidase complex-like protein DTM1 n=1 Tax=Mangifera indica TaxID=29780 RepID=UPI001CFB771B|nr:signal peptidase complex-like protein DTM1 [Mangifera indica]